MLYFNSFCVHNLEPGVNWFGIALVLQWRWGGAQGRPHQHSISNEGIDSYAMQQKAVSVYGFTGETQEVQEVAGKSLLTLRDKWIHSFNSSMNKKGRHSPI